MNYKRLTTKCEVGIGLTETDGNIVNDYEKVVNRLAQLEDKIENGTLIQLPCVRKVKFAGFDYVEAVYIQRNGTIGECICLNETEAKKKLEEFKNATI